MRTADQHEALPPVLAEAANSSGGYRRRWAAEWVRERFWVIPAVLLVLGTLIAVLTAGDIGPWRSWGGIPADPGWASGFLESIAGATLTFLGVVFTLTLVALQLASSQLSPRVIRTFVRSTVTRVAFGTLLAAFSFAVTALVIGHGHGGPAASRSVTVAAVLVAVSLIVFLRYVAGMMELLQVVDVIAAVARETKAAVAAAWLSSGAGRRAPAPFRSPVPVLLRLPGGRRGRRHAGPGRVLGVDHARLAELARRHDCVIELTVRMGEFVPGGGPFAAVHYPAGPSGPPLSAERAAAAVNLGRGRTLYQDPAFGLRQLADIAAQALSPAVNQPPTAVLVIDSLEDILLQIARAPRQSGCYTDQAGAVRLITRVPGWDELLDLAFTEITAYGASSPAVARRLLAAYDALEAAATPERGAGVAARREELTRQLAEGGLPQQAMQADQMGLG
jgi:uncharacterized membrane protein